MVMAKTPEERIDLKVLSSFLSPNFQNADRREIANRLKDQFMKDPELLATFERLLGSHTRGLAHIKPTAEELKSFGWSEEDVVACPAAVVAAAAATWGAAAAQSVR
jgi:hypothetical protein